MDAGFFLKALHVVGFVSWFAGLFYLVRIFVYLEESWEQEEPARTILWEQFTTMAWRVYKIICNPAMMITWVAGLGMLGLDLAGVTSYAYFTAGTPGWLHLKLMLLVVLLGYHLYCKRLLKRMEAGDRPLSAWQYRLYNEVPTLLLVSISFIAVYGKAGRLNYGYLLLGVALFALLVYRGAVAYRKRRLG
ncbi:MAG: TIGR00701 family protein [Bacteroidetes bacterium]|nr:MAG: TIGR00701 family protein [Bacteroidota bacterium]